MILIRAIKGTLTIQRHAHRPGQSRNNPAAKRRRNRARPSGAVRAVVLERDGYRCVRCGATRDLQMDHIIPIAKGGTKRAENLQTLCGACNSYKADRLV